MSNSYIFTSPLIATVCILAASNYGYSRVVCDALVVLCLGIQTIIGSQLFRASTRDALTGLLNRGMGERRLKTLLHKARRHNNHLAIVAMDIDHFKKINDTYGHPAGDKVLRQVAKLLLSICRSSDIIRMGGEEFLILLPHVHLVNACAIAERLRKAVADSVIDIGLPHHLQITASFGVAASDCGKHFLPSDLEKSADRALYQAKNNGRNRVICEFVPA